MNFGVFFYDLLTVLVSGILNWDFFEAFLRRCSSLSGVHNAFFSARVVTGQFPQLLSGSLNELVCYVHVIVQVICTKDLRSLKNFVP